MSDGNQARIDDAVALLKAGNLVSAHFALKKVLRRSPDDVRALLVSAEIHLRSGRPFDSVEVINRLGNMDTTIFNSSLRKQLGNLCFENELFALAVQHFEGIKAKGDTDVLSLYRLGIALRRLGKMDRAERYLRDCIELRPEVAASYLQLGHIYKARGDADKAVAYYKQSISLSTSERGTGYWSLADLKSYVFSDAEIADMKSEVQRRQEDLPQSSALHFALGKASEQKQDYAEAYAHYLKGNSIQAKLKPFHFAHFNKLVSELQDVGGGTPGVAENDGPVPVFIVGLPRSGTTLIEQILSAHSRVQATDELPFLERMALKLEMNGGYVKRLLALSEEERRSLREQYLREAGAYLEQDCDYFIDKYPGNFLHIGLIKQILPESIIIDSRRDPRDNAISAWRQLFNAGNEFSATFDDFYRYYKGYLELIDHWCGVFPNKIKVTSYEQLVTKPTEEIQALLDFCGLDRETGCFEFYNHKRAVTTPSVSQVTQPMYTSSIGQWQHYEAFLADDLSRLGKLREVV